MSVPRVVIHGDAGPLLRDLSLLALGMEALAHHAEGASASMQRLGRELRIGAMNRRTEACVRLFHSHPRWWLLRRAMGYAMRAAWLEATR